MATKKSSLPFVLVSEFSRRAAHELDNVRFEFLEFKKVDTFYALPVGEEYHPGIPDTVDHFALLSDTEHLEQNYVVAQADVRKMQAYLALLNVNKMIGGKNVSLQEFNAHREAIAKHTRYRENLSSQLRAQIRNFKAITHDQFSALNREVKNTALEEAGIEATIINHLLRITKTYALKNKYSFAPEHQPYIQMAEDYCNGKVSEYVQKVGADNLLRRMTATHLAKENLNIGASESGEMAEKIERLSGKDKQAVKYIIDQLLLKKQMSN